MPAKTTHPDQAPVAYLLRLADNALILGQRLAEWCGHGPVLEQDIALTNLALDLIGQARNWFQLAGRREGKGRGEDDLAFLRVAREYRNLLLVELPNGDFAHTVVRQCLFDQFHLLLLESLAGSRDADVAAIAAKSIKEVRYHLRFSSEWMIRLGDGTEESHRRMRVALDHTWPYAGEMLAPDALDTGMAEQGLGPDLATLAADYDRRLRATLEAATLPMPEAPRHQRGGKQGRHTEHLDYLLAEMQFMQRAYPDMDW